MLFLRQLWVLIKKDLLVLGLRSFFFTFIRAFAFPVVLIIVLLNIKNWTASSGYHGVGSPSPLKSLSDALKESGSARPRVVFANNGITDGDIGEVIKRLSTTIQNSGKELHIVNSYDDILQLCPSSTAGVSPCHAAVQFYSSPGHGKTNWNFTYYEDSSLGGARDVRSTSNDPQVYYLPFMHAIADTISQVQNGSALPQIMQFTYTSISQEEVDKEQEYQWQSIVMSFMGFAFFIAYSGVCYHLPGYVTFERERGILGLIDAMMPNKSRWQPPVIRTIATHISFDILYGPSWIVIGVLLKLSFISINVGWLLLTSILLGLALTSFSTLASSLFRRPQLAAISCIVTALSVSIAAMFGENPFLETSSLGAVIATALMFPPCTFIYIISNLASWELMGGTFDINAPPPLVRLGSTNSFNMDRSWSLATSPLLAFFVFQIVLYPILAIVIERRLWSTVSRARKPLPSASMGGVAVKLENFSRHYKSLVDKKKTVKAVDQLSMNVHQGSITILLGHNGSGKSTTLNAIAGLETITSGSIEVDAEGGVGICPQKNIMWDSLTVEEHVSLFEALKSSSSQTRAQRRTEVTRLIEGCDLSIKTKAKAKTLSGGQKRKLQLACMFAGGSQVCCIDEASSGIDPLARRKIWDILLAERGRRTMLLTTHFLDEADVLSDHVIIMSKGSMRAEGSVANLKHRLGGGYRIRVPGSMAIPAIENVKHSNDYTDNVFETADRRSLAKLVSHLEQNRIKNYKIQGPTIENVFLELIDEVKESKVAAEFDLSDDIERRLLELYTGKGSGFLKQTWTLFKKRLMILRHNFMPYVCAIFVSVVVAALVTRFLLADNWAKMNPTGLQCVDPKLNVGYSYTEHLNPFQIANGLNFGPLSLNNTIQRLTPQCTDSYCGDDQVDWSGMIGFDSVAAFTNYIKANAGDDYLGGFYLDGNSPLYAWNGATYGEVLTITLLDSILLNQTINAGYQNFQRSYVPGNSTVSMLTVFMALGFAIYPCLFALYPTAERLRGVRAMQYSNGIRASSSWTAHALFDLVFVLLISILTVVIWTTQWSGWYGIGYMFVVLFLYGLASTAFSYVISLMVKSQVAALAGTLVIQVVVSMLFFVSYVIVAMQAPAALVYTWFHYIYFSIGIISPAVHLVRALFMVSNNYSLVCHGLEKATYPGEITIYGGPILYLTLQFVFLLLLLIFWESGRSLEIFGIHRKNKDAKISRSQSIIDDPERLSQSNTGLRIINASKSFGSNQAVDDVSLGVLPSEKFALTGVNGAGKTTLISLIRGDLRGSGSIYIGGDSLETSPMAAKSHLGVCPQFDAQDLMTVTEHLRFYANARGVPNKEHNIKLLLAQLGLEPHANKLARKLSGGNMRKLSLAIALIANPSVLLLDEPSSGMDPAARRALWRTLRAISSGRSLLITTHSMEEADALCDRAGIMAGRLLALGDIEDLRSKHGSAACVHLVHKDAPHSHPNDMKKLRDFVLGVFPNAMLEYRSFGGQLRFSIPQTQLSLGQLYKLFEDRKDALGLVDYSVGPSTLDEVFLNVVRANNVQEENTDEKKSRWYRK